MESLYAIHTTTEVTMNSPNHTNSIAEEFNMQSKRGHDIRTIKSSELYQTACITPGRPATPDLFEATRESKRSWETTKMVWRIELETHIIESDPSRVPVSERIRDIYETKASRYYHSACDTPGRPCTPDVMEHARKSKNVWGFIIRTWRDGLHRHARNNHVDHSILLLTVVIKQPYPPEVRNAHPYIFE